MAAFVGPPAPFQYINVKCYLRYQQHDLQMGDELILVATSNHAGGTTVLVVQEDKTGNDQAFLKVIGTLEQRDVNRLNHTARAQNNGNFQSRAGPRVGSRYMPDIRSAVVAPFSPTYNNAYPANYGLIAGAAGAGGRKPYIDIRCACRV